MFGDLAKRFKKKYESENRVTKLPDPPSETSTIDQTLEYIDSNKTTVAAGVIILVIAVIILLWLLGGDEDED